MSGAGSRWASLSTLEALAHEKYLFSAEHTGVASLVDYMLVARHLGEGDHHFLDVDVMEASVQKRIEIEVCRRGFTNARNVAEMLRADSVLPTSLVCTGSTS